jgi:hypothetical protein
VGIIYTCYWEKTVRGGHPSFFSRFQAREREPKRAQGHEENKRKKAEVLIAKEKMVFPLFVAQHWKPGSRANSHSAGGKARVLSKMC